MNRPILIVVIGYIIGIIWGLYLKISIVPFYIFLITIYIIINLPYSKKKFRILPKRLKSKDFKLNKNSFSYTGKNIKPKIKTKINKKYFNRISIN